MRLGIDVGGTKVNIVLTDDAGKQLDLLPMVVPKQSTPEEVIALIAQQAQEVLVRNGVVKEDLIRIGMGVPGTTDGHVVFNAPNLHWQNVPCADIFESLFGVRPLIVQDTRAAAWGEYTLGAGAGKQSLVCATLGTGIGCGIVLNGAIYHGALGTAGEIGHIPVVLDGRKCNCGRSGCMETYASGTGLWRSCEEEPALNGKVHDTHELFDAAQNGDEAALQIINRGVECAAQALSAVINILSPDALIFSGGMCTQKTLYVEPLMRKIRELAYGLAVDDRLLMSVSPLGSLAPALGAAML